MKVVQYLVVPTSILAIGAYLLFLVIPMFVESIITVADIDRLRDFASHASEPGCFDAQIKHATEVYENEKRLYFSFLAYVRSLFVVAFSISVIREIYAYKRSKSKS